MLQPLYTFTAVAADFGGSLGLLLGLSALNLWDLGVTAVTLVLSKTETQTQ